MNFTRILQVAATHAAYSILLAACVALPVLAQTAAKPAPVTKTAPAAKPAPADDTDDTDGKDNDPNPVYHLLGFSLRGTKRVDTAAMVAALPEREGQVITQAEIKADAEKIGAELKAHHVHGNMTTSLMEKIGPGHHVWVMWYIQPMDALSYAPKPFKRFFVSQSFTGNTKLSTAALVAATGLHPGDKMPDGSVSDARTGIEQAYDPILHGATVGVKGKVKVKPDYGVIIDWQIDEPKSQGSK